jgi:hypothetical protein
MVLEPPAAGLLGGPALATDFSRGLAARQVDLRLPPNVDALLWLEMPSPDCVAPPSRENPSHQLESLWRRQVSDGQIVATA